MKMEYRFRAAQEQDVDSIIEIIKDRIKWMDQKQLHQWNKTDYMKQYPREYFLRRVRAGEFYLVCNNGGEPMGAIALLTEDPRWKDDEPKPCYYAHHLAAKRSAHGAGRALLMFCEQFAKGQGKVAIRLDCQKGNDRLNDFYAQLGYQYVAPMKEDNYEGIKREKQL